MRRIIVACALAAGLATPAAAAWSEARSSHFIIYSEQRPAELKRYAEDLERFDQVVRRMYHLPDPELTDNGRLPIYVLRDANAVERLNGKPNAAGFYVIGPAGVRAFVHREPQVSQFQLSAQSVFFHEYLHHLMLGNNALALPSWLIEGSAELFSTADIQKDGSVMIGRPAMHRAFALLRLSGLSTERLVGGDAKLTPDERQQLYGRGWLLTHMLTFSPARSGQLGRYLAEIQKGVPALDAARSAFGDLRTLDRDLDSYLTQPRLTVATVSAASLRPGPVAVRTLGPGQSAMMPVIIRSQRGVLPRDAADVLAEARRIAVRFPDDPAVLAALSEAEQDAGDNAAAIVSAERALAIDPRSSKALVIKARALLAEGRKEPAKANWASIRAAIGRANKLDPDHAEPLVLFYQSFLAQGIRPTANAAEGLAYAQLLLPQSGELRMLLVRQRVMEGRFAEATRLFGPIAYDPHAGATRAQRLQLMAALKAGSMAQAQALIEQTRASEEARRH